MEARDSISEESDDAALARLGYKSEMLREFGNLSTFSFAFSIMGMCSSIATTFNTPLALGGPSSVVWCWFMGSILNISLGASIAEIVSAYPTSGGKWHILLPVPLVSRRKYSRKFALTTNTTTTPPPHSHSQSHSVISPVLESQVSTLHRHSLSHANTERSSDGLPDGSTCWVRWLVLPPPSLVWRK